MPLRSVVEFLHTVDELEQAKSLLKTFEKYSRSLEQYDTLGMLYEKIKAYPDSLRMLEKCLAIAKNPNELLNIRANLAKVYNHVNEPLKSIFYSDLNLKINPNDYDALMEKSFSYYLHGDIDKSYEIQKDLLLIPELPEEVKNRINFNMGTFEMENGNFKVGLYKMIMGGKEIGIWKPIQKPWPKWTGEHTDKTILIYAEAGIGDEMINIRFAKEIEKRGMKYLWVGSRKDTNELFKSNGFNVTTEKELRPGDYVYCESMSLPILLDLDIDQLWDKPYLIPKQEYIDKWKKILPEKFITLRWAGNPYYDQDLHRSINFDLLFSKAKEFNLPIVSLQIDVNKIETDGLINLEGINSWEDTLAIQHLALMNITSCTSTAHSASASGAKCIVLPPIATYYTWHNLVDDCSPWYGKTTKVYPQRTWKDWTNSINKAMNHLSINIV